MNAEENNHQLMAAFKNATRIHAVHLLNDFSGSPLVFREALISLKKSGKEVLLYTATPSGKGFLSELENIKENPIFYTWSRYKLLTLFYYLLAQILLFFKLLKRIQKNDVVYVNTLLPFAALLAGKVKGAKTVMHIHEVSLSPALLKNTLVNFAEQFSNELIFVSRYVAGQYTFKKPNTRIVFNTLPDAFIARANESFAFNTKKETILMLCSLKAYKGIYEFLQLANLLPQYSFELVLNASKESVNQWKEKNSVPFNCKLYSSQSNTHPFYERAKIVMNLSRPDEWIETFGMTILEAMAYRCFVIVPLVGGPIELLEKYNYGKAIDGKNYAELVSFVQAIFQNRV